MACWILALNFPDCSGKFRTKNGVHRDYIKIYISQWTPKADAIALSPSVSTKAIKRYIYSNGHQAYMPPLTRSQVPSPASTYGRSIPRETTKQAIYNGDRLPAFLKAQGGDPEKYLEFLAANRFGSIYDLEAGMLVVVPQVSASSTFATHPEA